MVGEAGAGEDGEVASATASGAAGSVPSCARAGCARPSEPIREATRVATNVASTMLERRLHSPSCKPSPSAASLCRNPIPPTSLPELERQLSFLPQFPPHGKPWS